MTSDDARKDLRLLMWEEFRATPQGQELQAAEIARLRAFTLPDVFLPHAVQFYTLVSQILREPAADAPAP